MPAAGYFSPAYFSPFYFPRLVRLGGGTGPQPPAGYRDRDAFAAIASALAATGEFAAIIVGGPLESVAIGADRLPLAAILPAAWTEVDVADPIVNLRQVAYRLILVVRDEDPGQRFEMLDRLASIAQNAIDGSDLDGGCLGGLTKLRWGHYDPESRHPEQRVSLTGTFSYLVAPHAGHSTDS